MGRPGIRKLDTWESIIAELCAIQRWCRFGIALDAFGLLAVVASIYAIFAGRFWQWLGLTLANVALLAWGKHKQREIHARIVRAEQAADFLDRQSPPRREAAHGRTFPVKFTGMALEDWRRAWPDLPPGDEVALMMRVDPCKACGREVVGDEIGGFDPVEIVDGVLVGDHVCKNCMEKGH